MIFYLVIALILAAGVVVLFGSNYLLYISVIDFFSITDTVQKNILLAVILFFTASFIVSSILAHWKESVFTRLYYFASGLWLGLLANLTIACVLLWIIFFTFPSLLKNHPATLAVIFFALAFTYSLYGIWNAFHPRLKHITVSIPNLPDNWKGKKIVQISDTHIGHVYKNIFMKGVTTQINSVNPEMVVITGDLLDGMDGKLEDPLKFLDDINAPRGIYFITGNHETILGTDFVNAALEKTKVKMMKDEVIDIDGLKLIGINYPEHGETRNAIPIIEKLKGQYFGQPNILLYHSPVNIEKFKENGVNLQLSGHTHNYQIFPLNLLAKIIFKGYNYGFYQSENYSLYVTSGTGTWGPAVRTGNKPEIVVITLK